MIPIDDPAASFLKDSSPVEQCGNEVLGDPGKAG